MNRLIKNQDEYIIRGMIIAVININSMTRRRGRAMSISTTCSTSSAPLTSCGRKCRLDPILQTSNPSLFTNPLSFNLLISPFIRITSLYSLIWPLFDDSQLRDQEAGTALADQPTSTNTPFATPTADAPVHTAEAAVDMHQDMPTPHVLDDQLAMSTAHVLDEPDAHDPARHDIESSA